MLGPQTAAHHVPDILINHDQTHLHSTFWASLLYCWGSEILQKYINQDHTISHWDFELHIYDSCRTLAERLRNGCKMGLDERARVDARPSTPSREHSPRTEAR